MNNSGEIFHIKNDEHLKKLVKEQGELIQLSDEEAAELKKIDVDKRHKELKHIRAKKVVYKRDGAFTKKIKVVSKHKKKMIKASRKKNR